MEFVCPFCRGAGVDPYVPAVPAPTCPVCRGARTVEVTPDPRGRYVILADELVRFDATVSDRCEHVWDFADREGTTWNVCIRCGRGELWADGMLISSTDPEESARLDMVGGERVSVVGALL